MEWRSGSQTGQDSAKLSLYLRTPPGKQTADYAHSEPTFCHRPGSPSLPVELALQGIQPTLHIAPGPPARAGQRDVEEAGGRGGTSWQLLILAAPTVPPKAENVGHPRKGACSRESRGKAGEKATPTPTPPRGLATPPVARPRPYQTVGCMCRSCHHPRSGSLRPAAPQGALGWRRAPGAVGWSCGPDPHLHCFRGWRGHWMGCPPMAFPAGPSCWALHPPGLALRPAPPPAVQGLQEEK